MEQSSHLFNARFGEGCRFLMHSLLKLSCSFGLLCASAALSAQAPMPFTDANLPMQQRVDDLVSRMTLEEKVSEMINTSAAIPRLNVPAYDWWNEGLHGVARSGYATLFPQAIGMAAAWDTNLLGRIATTISTEARAKYNEAVRHNIRSIYYGLTIWSPNINIFRDPRWGRGQETYGEDPHLTADAWALQLYPKACRAPIPGIYKVIATPKAFRSALRARGRAAIKLRRAAHAARPVGTPTCPQFRAGHRRCESRQHHVRLQPPWMARPRAASKLLLVEHPAQRLEASTAL